MRAQVMLGVGFVVTAGLSLSALAAKPGSTTTQVTSVTSDYDSGVSPVALQIRSDGRGNYVPTPTSPLKSEFINNGGTWAIDSYYVAGATRTLYLDFSEPVSGTVPTNTVLPPSGYYKARIGSECFRVGNSFLALMSDETMDCPMNVHFDSGGKTYDLHMARSNANFPETESAHITCFSPPRSATGQAFPCSKWRLSPTGTYLATDGSTRQANVANLSYETTVKGRLTYVKQGNFRVSFSIIVTNP